MRLKDQRRARELLERLSEKKRIPGALLFYGPPGVGKTTGALEFSKGLLCTEGAAWGCNGCPSCTHMEHLISTILAGEWEEISLTEETNGKRTFLYLLGEHPDFIFVPPSGNSIRIDQIRAAKEFSYRKPALSRRKVILIDDAHLMTRESANALLKVLEEPPADTHFILVSEGKDSLLPTVVSRTYSVEFLPLDREDFFRLLGEEDELIYRLSGGSLSKARTLKEKGSLLRSVEDFIGGEPSRLFALSQELEKADIEEKILFLELLEERLREAFLNGDLNYDRFEAMERRIGEIREGVGHGVKFSLALSSLYALWR